MVDIVNFQITKFHANYCTLEYLQTGYHLTVELWMRVKVVLTAVFWPDSRFSGGLSCGLELCALHLYMEIQPFTVE